MTPLSTFINSHIEHNSNTKLPKLFQKSKSLFKKWWILRMFVSIPNLINSSGIKVSATYPTELPLKLFTLWFNTFILKILQEDSLKKPKSQHDFIAYLNLHNHKYKSFTWIQVSYNKSPLYKDILIMFYSTVYYLSNNSSIYVFI